jgi:hypothetical protein
MCVEFLILNLGHFYIERTCSDLEANEIILFKKKTET